MLQITLGPRHNVWLETNTQQGPSEQCCEMVSLHEKDRNDYVALLLKGEKRLKKS